MALDSANNSMARDNKDSANALTMARNGAPTNARCCARALTLDSVNAL